MTPIAISRFPLARASAVLSLLCLAFPAAAAAEGGGGGLTIPWGEWVASGLGAASSALVPVAAAALAAGVARVAPWASSILTRQRIETAIRAGADYGQNAVAGAVRGKSVSVDLGAAVVAAGTKHVVETTPARVVRGAGGVEGIARQIFRSLPLDAQGSAETVLAPALRLLKQDPPHKA